MYKTLLIVDDLTLNIQNEYITTISFRDYVDQYPKKNEYKVQIINFCDISKYLSTGYYCSLLAEARKHTVLPPVSAINDLRKLSTENELINPFKSSFYGNTLKILDINAIEEFYIYFGEADNPKCQKLAKWVFATYTAPIIKVTVKHTPQGPFLTINTPPFLSLSDLQQTHCMSALDKFVMSIWKQPKSRKKYRWDMAILVNPNESQPPSNKTAIHLFIKAARKLGINAECVTAQELQLISRYDALFIRETTEIDHYTYQIARRCEQENIVVIDDSASILRCCNKIYLHDAYSYYQIPSLKTCFAYDSTPETIAKIESQIDYPMVLKMPESSFSKGVYKVNSHDELKQYLTEHIQRTALLLVQEYMYTPFDWRIGVLNGRPIYACKYYMAHNHWQIYNHKKSKILSGKFDTLPTFEVPKVVLDAAVKACSVVGNGLYGVDLKQKGKQVYVIEINDNPNIDHGVEDLYLGNELYMLVMLEFLERLEKRGK